VISIDSYRTALSGTAVLGNLFFMSKVARHLVFNIFPFPLGKSKRIGYKIVLWVCSCNISALYGEGLRRVNLIPCCSVEFRALW